MVVERDGENGERVNTCEYSLKNTKPRGVASGLRLTCKPTDFGGRGILAPRTPRLTDCEPREGSQVYVP